MGDTTIVVAETETEAKEDEGTATPTTTKDMMAISMVVATVPSIGRTIETIVVAMREKAGIATEEDTSGANTRAGATKQTSLLVATAEEGVEDTAIGVEIEEEKGKGAPTTAEDMVAITTMTAPAILVGGTIKTIVAAGIDLLEKGFGT